MFNRLLRHCGIPFPTIFFFFNDTATTEIYTLSLHDALPIYVARKARLERGVLGQDLGESGDQEDVVEGQGFTEKADRKSTRLNSSHGYISYAVFCLKKKITTSTKAVSASPQHPGATCVIAPA